MQKKIMYIGLALMALSVVAFVAAASSPAPSLPHGAAVIGNATIPVQGYKAVPVTVNGTSLVDFYATSSGASNVFLFNQSAFSTWNASVQRAPYNGLEIATSLEGAGVMVIYNGTSAALVPPVAPYSPSYASNVLSATQGLLPAGTYYLVIENMNGTHPNAYSIYANFAYVPNLSINLSGQALFKLSSGGFAAMLLFVTGMIILIFGALRPNAAAIAKGTPTQEEIDALYRGKRSDRYKNSGSHKKIEREKPRA